METLLFPRLRNEKKTDEVRTLSGNREAVAAERAPDIRGGLRNLGWIKKVLGI